MSSFLDIFCIFFFGRLFKVVLVVNKKMQMLVSPFHFFAILLHFCKVKASIIRQH